MKMKREHRVPLTDQMLKLLDRLKSISGDSAYLFPQSRNAEKHMSSQTVNLILKRIGYKGRLVSHGFRAVASTYLYDQGHKPEVIESCLAHVFGNMTVQAYNRSDFFKLRIKLMKEWSDYVADKYEKVDSIVARLYPEEQADEAQQTAANAEADERSASDTDMNASKHDAVCGETPDTAGAVDGVQSMSRETDATDVPDVDASGAAPTALQQASASDPEFVEQADHENVGK